MTFHMYVTISDEDRVSIFTADPDTGRIEHQEDVVVRGRPAPLAVDPNLRFLYVGRRDDIGVTSFQIDWRTGGLSPIGEIPLESDPCYLATDRKGRFLLSAYYSAGKVAVHPIGYDGAVSAQPVEWLDTATGAHSMQTDPSNRFVFVPHIADRGPNLIFQYKFDESSGRLTPNSPPRLSPEANAGPRHYCFHPNKDILYFSNEQGCSVTAYGLNSSMGTLSAIQTVSTLPDDYNGTNTCAQIQISPSGRFLYAPNRGHNTIAGFSVDSSTGALRPIGHTPTEAVPRAFSLDSDGKFLYVAGLESGRLASYRIDGETGDLEPLETHTVGRGPMWVLLVRSDS